MFVLVLLSAAAAIAYLFLAIYAGWLGADSRVNRAFFLFCISLAIWSFATAFLLPARTASDALFWDYFGAPGWAFFGPLALHFVILMTGRNPRKIWLVLLYVPGAISLATEWMLDVGTDLVVVQAPLGWVLDYHDSVGSVGFYEVCTVGCLVTALALLPGPARHARRALARRQASLVFWTGRVSLILGLATDVILPLFLGPSVPPLSYLFGLIWAGGMWWAMTRLKMLTVSPRMALDQILSGIQDVFLLLDEEGRILEANRRALELMGRSRTDLLTRPLTEFLDDPAGFGALLDALRSDPGAVRRIEETLLPPAGEPIRVRLTGSALRDPAGEFAGAAIVGQDVRPSLLLDQEVAGRRRAEDDLASEKERLRVTLESIADGVVTTDTSGRVMTLNRVAEELTGWSRAEAAGRPIEEVLRIVDEARRHEEGESLRTTPQTEPPGGGFLLLARDGAERLVSRSIARIQDAGQQAMGWVVVFRDVTRRRKINEELQKANKLESVGLLAGGIAHDFNNLLTGIQGYVTLARLDLPEGRPSTRLGEAEAACRRAQALTQQLLTFSRGGIPLRRSVALGAVLRESSSLVLAGSRVRCDRSVPDDLWPVWADEGQVSQAVNNLVINAAQAMPDGGVVTIEARNLPLGAPLVDGGVTVPAGEWVRVSIRDEGPGIAPEHLPRIFDPFFTTKPSGTGLGLPTTYSIVRRHEGHITVGSRPGEGATFHIYLPRAATEPEVAHEPQVVAPSFQGRVLVMDDEAVVRSVAREMLDALGWAVDLCADGSEVVDAWLAARRAGRPYDMVILDYTVPGGISGAEAVRRLREVAPTVPVILSSGYSESTVFAEFRAWGFDAVLPKPYRLDQLSRVLEQAGARKTPP